MCRVIVVTGGYRMAWVGFAEDDPEQSIRPVAWAGAEEGYLSTVRMSWGEAEAGQGPSGRAIRTGEPQFNRDTRVNPFYGPWREEALRRGYLSSIVIPLQIGGKVAGMAAIYAG